MYQHLFPAKFVYKTDLNYESQCRCLPLQNYFTHEYQVEQNDMDSKMKNYPVLYSMEIYFHYVFPFSI